MAGRPKDSEIKKIEKKIRTITWFKSVLIASSTENSNQFSNSEYGNFDGERKWSNYSKGIYTPTETTLKVIENKLPGTCEIFEDGPRKSFLFRVMTEDIDDLINDLEAEQDFFFWISPISHEISFYRIENFELKELVYLLEQIYFENRVYEIGPYLTDTPESYLVYLSGCIIVLRFAMDRDMYVRSSYVDDLLNIVFHILRDLCTNPRYSTKNVIISL